MQQLPNPIETGKEYRKTATIHAVQMPEPFEVQSAGGIQKGEAGDYLVCNASAPADLWPIAKAVFEKTYVPA